MRRRLLQCCCRTGYGHWRDEGSCETFALESDRLTVRYPGASRPAINEVSFTIRPGECVALTGDNGSGKSTLLKAAAGLIEPQQGAVRVFGCAVGRCQTRVSYLPQRGELAWHFPIDVQALVMTGRFVHMGWFRRPRREDHRRVEQALDRLGIRDLARTQIGRLSGGQQQRVLFARTLVHGADLILLDEPSNAVDADTVEVILDVVAELAHEGKAVLVATHDHERFHPRCDRMMLLQSGRLVEDSPCTASHGCGDTTLRTPTLETEHVA